MRIIKKWHLLSFVWRCAVCVALFLILSGVKKALPDVYGFIEKALTRSADIKKICSLLYTTVQEIFT